MSDKREIPVPEVSALFPQPPKGSIAYWDDDGVYIFCPEQGSLVFFTAIYHADQKFHIKWFNRIKAGQSSAAALDPDFKAVYIEIMTMHPYLRGMGYLSGTGRWEWEKLYE